MPRPASVKWKRAVAPYLALRGPGGGRPGRRRADGDSGFNELPLGLRPPAGTGALGGPLRADTRRYHRLPPHLPRRGLLPHRTGCGRGREKRVAGRVPRREGLSGGNGRQSNVAKLARGAGKPATHGPHGGVAPQGGLPSLEQGRNTAQGIAGEPDHHIHRRLGRFRDGLKHCPPTLLLPCWGCPT